MTAVLVARLHEGVVGVSEGRQRGGSMQSRSPVRETAAGKRKTACCPC